MSCFGVSQLSRTAGGCVLVTVFVLGKNLERTVFADNEGKLRDRITSDHGVKEEYMV
jgi:hypothetical protein